MTLRITAGTAKGRRVRSLEGLAVRPTAAKVRQALFNILGGRVAGARWLDLFAGGGTMALEALSRGAAEAVCVEQTGAALRVLRQNLAELGFADRCRIVQADALAYLRRPPAAPFDLVFLDPPYAAGLYDQALLGLLAPGWLCDEARVVAEVGLRRPPPVIPPGLLRISEHRYGDSALIICGIARQERGSPANHSDEVS